VKNS
jgi:hypothetical protein